MDVSRVLGHGIVAGSAFLKVPQIYAIVRSGSVEGLSEAAFELEAAGLTVSLAYCLSHRLPFSAYGEVVFLLLQSLASVAVLYHYSPTPQLGRFTLLKSALYCAVAPSLLAGRLDARLVEALYALFFAARIPQIYHTWRAKRTGELSFLSNFLSVIGCAARSFTTIEQNAPLSMILGSIFGLLTNGVVCAQILTYKDPPDDKRREKVE